MARSTFALSLGETPYWREIRLLIAIRFSASGSVKPSTARLVWTWSTFMDLLVRPVKYRSLRREPVRLCLYRAYCSLSGGAAESLMVNPLLIRSAMDELRTLPNSSMASGEYPDTAKRARRITGSNLLDRKSTRLNSSHGYL